MRSGYRGWAAGGFWFGVVGSLAGLAVGDGATRIALLIYLIGAIVILIVENTKPTRRFARPE